VHVPRSFGADIPAIPNARAAEDQIDRNLHLVIVEAAWTAKALIGGSD
jgi:hypothetical protein